jgi:hypothetical protein
MLKYTTEKNLCGFKYAKKARFYLAFFITQSRASKRNRKEKNDFDR